MSTTMSPEASLEGHPVTGETKLQGGAVATSAENVGTPPAAGGGGAPDPGLNLFVANLSGDVDDELFRTTFGTYGTILSAKVMLDIHTGISRGFGFVLYQNESEGLRALAELQGKAVGKRDNPMVITRAQTTGRNAVNDTPKLHMRNVPKSVSEAELNTLLSKYGQTERVIMKEDTDVIPGTPMGQAGRPSQTWRVFVQYTTAAEANAAVAALHNSRPWPDMGVPLMAKPAETPEMRQARKARQDSRKPVMNPQQQQQQQQQQMHRGGGPPGSPNASGSPQLISVQVGPGGQPMMVQQQQPMMVMGPGGRAFQVAPQQQAGGGMMIPQYQQQQQPMFLLQQHNTGGGYNPQQQPHPQQGLRMFPQGGASMSDSTEFSFSNSWSQQPNMMMLNGQPVQMAPPPGAQFMVSQQNPIMQQPMQQQPMQYQQQGGAGYGANSSSHNGQPPPQYVQMPHQHQQQQHTMQGESLVPVFSAPPQVGNGTYMHTAPPPQQFMQVPQHQQQQAFARSHSPPSMGNNGSSHNLSVGAGGGGSNQPASPLVPPLHHQGSPQSIGNLEASIEEMSRSGHMGASVHSGHVVTPQQQAIGVQSPQILTGSPAQLQVASQPQYVMMVPQPHK